MRGSGLVRWSTTAIVVATLAATAACSGTGPPPVTTTAGVVGSTVTSASSSPAADPVTVLVPHSEEVRLPGTHVEASRQDDPERPYVPVEDAPAVERIDWSMAGTRIATTPGIHVVPGSMEWTGRTVDGRVIVYPADHPIVVAAVGDSITFGDGLGDRVADSYPAQLQAMLGTGFDVRNLGVPGATLLGESPRPYTGQPAYLESLQCDPDVVVIQLGTNDSADSYSGQGEEFVRQYRELVDAYRALPTHPLIVVAFPPVVTQDDPQGIRDEGVRRVIGWIRAAMATDGYDDVVVVDNYAATLGLPAGSFPDGVHPGVAASRTIASTVCAGFAGGACETSP